MRISDDRYTRDRQRLDLGLRLIRHEARTYTIRQWTGLSDDRIRKLYKSYCADGSSVAIARHRGKSPRQTAYFFRNSETHFHAAQLASLFVVYGLLGWAGNGVRQAYATGSLSAGATLCSAYETYGQLHAPVMISFEHAWFLLIALTRRVEIGVQKCGCGGVRLLDLLARRQAVCSTCGESGRVTQLSLSAAPLLRLAATPLDRV
jgi:hypothetical protein